MWRSVPKAAPGSYYPFVHAREDGVTIQVLDEEFLQASVEDHRDTPILKAYLRWIGGRIRVDGKSVP
jgi:hypothetical protein